LFSLACSQQWLRSVTAVWVCGCALLCMSAQKYALKGRSGLAGKLLRPDRCTSLAPIANRRAGCQAAPRQFGSVAPRRASRSEM
jgi:hypothetical protein